MKHYFLRSRNKSVLIFVIFQLIRGGPIQTRLRYIVGTSAVKRDRFKNLQSCLFYESGSEFICGLVTFIFCFRNMATLEVFEMLEICRKDPTPKKCQLYLIFQQLQIFFFALFFIQNCSLHSELKRVICWDIKLFA